MFESFRGSLEALCVLEGVHEHKIVILPEAQGRSLNDQAVPVGGPNHGADGYGGVPDAESVCVEADWVESESEGVVMVCGEGRAEIYDASGGVLSLHEKFLRSLADNPN
ncbi:unnamed protein product [Calypogeia fissa]